MKKIVLFIVTCVIVTNAVAQNKAKELNRVKYRVDTLRANGEVILQQRYVVQDLNAVYGNNANQNRVVTAITKLQETLDNRGRYAEKGMQIDGLEYIEQLFNEIKNEKTDFDYSRFRKETDAYIAINSKLAAAKEEERRKKSEELTIARRKAAIEEKARRNAADSLMAVHERERNTADSIQRIADAKEEQAQHKAILKKYGSVTGNAIIHGKVKLGMTPEMCQLAWGEPSTVSKSTSKAGVVERWVYSALQFLVFQNGKLTSFNEGGTND